MCWFQFIGVTTHIPSITLQGIARQQHEWFRLILHCLISYYLCCPLFHLTHCRLLREDRGMLERDARAWNNPQPLHAPQPQCQSVFTDQVIHNISQRARQQHQHSRLTTWDRRYIQRRTTGTGATADCRKKIKNTLLQKGTMRGFPQGNRTALVTTIWGNISSISFPSEHYNKFTL